MRNDGFSLIEILFTMFISSVGVLGVAVLQFEAIKVSSDANARSHASLMMQSIVDRIRINRQGAKENAYRGINSCDMTPPKMCGHYFFVSRIRPEACSSSELAHYDEWDIVCSFPAQTNRIYGAQNFVSNAKLTIDCSDYILNDVDACSSGSKIHLNLSWHERSTNLSDGIASPNVSIDEVIYL